MFNIKELLEDMGIKPFKAGHLHGGEYHSACPGCGDGSPRRRDRGPSDRFQIWPERRDGGYYTCRRCGLHGDNIQFLIDFQHKSFHEACQILDIKKSLERRRSRPTPKPPAHQQQECFAPHTNELPSEAWMTKAKEFAEWCHGQLLVSAEARGRLHSRGLSMATAQRYLLGYNPGDKGGDLRRARKAWGMEDVRRDDGKLKALWLPRGLVMPVIDREGRVVQLRIRRLDADVARFCQAIKYQFVEGGSHATLVLEPEAKAFVVVESGLDAFLCAQDGAGLIGAVTTWTAKAGPDEAATAILKESLRILVALDADQAGVAGSAKWLATFRQARRWPVPQAKDPGDAKRAGVDLRQWIIAGLPPALTMGDHGASGCAVNQGGGEGKPGHKEEGYAQDDPAVREMVVCSGHHDSDSEGAEVASGVSEKNQSQNKAEKEGPLAAPHAVAAGDDDLLAGAITGISADGREYLVVETKEQWDAAVAQGKLVFSRGEVERLHAARQACGPDGAAAMASAVLDVKEVFEGSYIRRGGPAKEEAL